MAEYFDVINPATGEPTGETVLRETAHLIGIPHRTAHLWIARHHDGHEELLLQKRCMQKDSYPGCYDISSAGHIPAGSGFVESALRELMEELGIPAEPRELLFCGDRYGEKDDCFYGRPFHDREYSRVFLLWRDLAEEAFTPQPDEVESVRWMPVADILAGMRDGTLPNCIVGEELAMVMKAMNIE